MMLFAAAAAMTAQSIEVRGEYRRPGPDGAVIDRAGRPREILSPLAGRNGYFSLYAIVRVPAGKPYQLFAAQNPAESVSATIYRVRPAALEEAIFPIEEEAPPSGVSIFWVDVWIPPTAEVKRVRVELQLHVDDRWIIYPMEFRISQAVYPGFGESWCGEKLAPGPALRPEAFIYRNRLQDAALARTRPDFAQLRAEACPAIPPSDPEAYLGLRSRLLTPD